MIYYIDDSIVPGEDYIENVIRMGKRTVRQEDGLLRLINYTTLSAYTSDPINLGVLAPTSEGKTYPVMQAMNFVDRNDVWIIGSMTPKVLVRQKGVLVDRENAPIGDRLNELRKIIRSKDASPELKDEAYMEVSELKENARSLIDLSGKTLVFLEPPQRELWNIIKPMLSHDSWEMEFPYVDKSDVDGIHVKNIVVRGWPACIFCSAKDESLWPGWKEIESRFFIVSPTMTRQKRYEANQLIAQRKGLPNQLQQQIIISDKEVNAAREAWRYTRDEIKERSRGGKTGKGTPVWIPYYWILGDILPAEKGTDNRHTQRIMSLLNIVALARAHIRPQLVYGQERLTIATLEDLAEVLHITQDVTGLPVYKLKFFRELFLRAYKSKTAPDQKDGKQEPRIGITSRELAEVFPTVYDGRVITTDNLKKTYLDDLEAHGYIDKVHSEIDPKQYLFYPIIDVDDDSNKTNLTKESQFDKGFKFSKLPLPRDCKNVPENWLILSILELIATRIDPPKFRLLAPNGREICICQFVSEYQKEWNLARLISPHKFKIFCNASGDMLKSIEKGSCDCPNNLSNCAEIDKKDSPAMATKTNESQSQQSSTSAIVGNPPGVSHQMDSPLGDNHAAFDLEYLSDGRDPAIYTGAIVDSKGRCSVLHARDFSNSEAALVRAIVDEIKKYPVTVGWGTTIISEHSSTHVCEENTSSGGDSI